MYFSWTDKFSLTINKITDNKEKLGLSKIPDTLRILFTRISVRSNGNKFAIYIIQRWQITTGSCESSKKNCYFNPQHPTNQSTQQIISVITYSTHLTFTLIGGNEENIFCCLLDEVKWAGKAYE